MTSSVNKVILIGCLGQDPESRFLPSGAAVANVNIATNCKWKDKQTGEMQEKTEWHKLVFFGRKAEIVSQYLTKGSKIYVEGRLQTKKWQDENDNTRYSTEIVVNDMQMLSGKNETPSDDIPF